MLELITAIHWKSHVKPHMRPEPTVPKAPWSYLTIFPVNRLTLFIAYTSLTRFLSALSGHFFNTLKKMKTAIVAFGVLFNLSSIVAQENCLEKVQITGLL